MKSLSFYHDGGLIEQYAQEGQKFGEGYYDYIDKVRAALQTSPARLADLYRRANDIYTALWMERKAFAEEGGWLDPGTERRADFTGVYRQFAEVHWGFR